jgi:esterase/lipase
MVSVWMAAMAFDSRRRLAEIKCPTLVVAASRDEAVPLHHAMMLHDGITGTGKDFGRPAVTQPAKANIA